MGRGSELPDAGRALGLGIPHPFQGGRLSSGSCAGTQVPEAGWFCSPTSHPEAHLGLADPNHSHGAAGAGSSFPCVVFSASLPAMVGMLQLTLFSALFFFKISLINEETVAGSKSFCACLL